MLLFTNADPPHAINDIVDLQMVFDPLGSTANVEGQFLAFGTWSVIYAATQVFCRLHTIDNPFCADLVQQQCLTRKNAFSSRC